jgi:hypothetical protein
MQRWFLWLGVVAVVLGILLETATLYKNSQETIVNRNTIREGKATADTAEATAKINANNIAKSKYEAQKLKAEADSAESLALINKNYVAKSVYEAAKLKADADGAESLAIIEKNNVAISAAKATEAAIVAKWAKDVNDCDVHCRGDRALRDLWR